MKNSLNFCKKSKGFTLVELVIVIAIVIILSVVSVPIYQGYVRKAKMAEGYALLGTILSAQKAYYSEHGNFLMPAHSVGDTCYDPILGIDARGNKYFTWFWVTGNTTTADPRNKVNFGANIPRELQEKGNCYLRLFFTLSTRTTIYEVDW